MSKSEQSVQFLAATDPLARAVDALRGSAVSQTDSGKKKKKLDKVSKDANQLLRDVSKHAARHMDLELRGGLANARLQEGSAKLKALSSAAVDPKDRKALKGFADRADKLGRAVKLAAR